MNIRFGVGVEVDLLECFDEKTNQMKDTFLIAVETLERIGAVNKKDKIIIPSCYIWHNSGRYYIMHFKEMFQIDGQRSEKLNDDDTLRRTCIANLLHEWKIIKIKNKNDILNILPIPIYAIKAEEIKDYTIIHKYNIRK